MYSCPSYAKESLLGKNSCRFLVSGSSVCSSFMLEAVLTGRCATCNIIHIM